MKRSQDAPADDGTHRPRPNDHLVEPFFGGLGVEEEAPARPDRKVVESEEVEAPSTAGGWFQRLWRALKRG